jgi:hypothetical protein
MSSQITNFQNNRSRLLSEQINYWRFNLESGFLRLVERLLFRFNVSDVLGGDLGQIKHLVEVRSQIIGRELIESALLPISSVPISEQFIFEATSPQYLIHLRNARVDVLTGLIYLNAGFVIDSTLAKWQKLLYRGGVGSAIKRARRASENISGAYMVMPHTPFYYHAVIDEIPNLLKARNKNPRFTNVIVHKLTEKWAIDLLSRLGFNVVILKENAAIVEELITVTAPRALNAKNIELLRSSVSAIPEKILIVSRSGAPRSDDSIELAIKSAIPEAELINPSDISVDEQIEIFSHAKAIIGLHGGALTNTVWMDSSGRMVEIFNHAYRTSDYENLCRELGQGYLSIEASSKTLNELVQEVRDFIYE